jgi:hypothetical protein
VQPYPVDEPVFAACCTPAGRWSIVASCCQDWSGRIGVRRIAVLDELASGGPWVKGTRARLRISCSWGDPQEDRSTFDIGGTIITSSITNAAVDELKLAKGQTAYAVIKASDVMVALISRLIRLTE